LHIKRLSALVLFLANRQKQRRATLLKEMHDRHKTGGLVDRRFGENDPTMTPEERAAERFARESQKKMRKESMFNLEDEEEDFKLTHMGQSLTLDGKTLDDFDAEGLGGGESDDEGSRKRKRALPEDGEEEEEEDEDFIDFGAEGEGNPERKKSKAEVMKEVIAKSKFHKHERQQAKEDDDDLRDELDKELPDLFEALRGMKAPPKQDEPAQQDLAAMNPERAAMMQAPEQQDTEKQYDQRLKQLTFDKRSAPTDRTKTVEEKAEEEAERLKKLEDDRLKRMRGENVSDDEDMADDDKDSFFAGDESEEEEDDAMAFGLPTSSTVPRPADMGVEDEDDFVIDDDLVETRSNVSLSLDGSDVEEEELSEDDEPDVAEQEDELINGMTLPTSTTETAVGITQSATGKLAFTYPCPADHDSFLEIIQNVPAQDVPTVVQRIRALHHPRLKPGNKDKLGRFAEILVEHIAYMADETEEPSFAVIENILRHIHSLAKTHAINVATAFRARLREISKVRPLNLIPGDLVVLSGISTIFPTSDHFHAVSTPAHLCIARYLGQCNVEDLTDLASGAFAASLIVQYQAISKRYMPEFINYVLNALCNLAPTEMAAELRAFPPRKIAEHLRLESSKRNSSRKLQFDDVIKSPVDSKTEEELKMSLITTFASLLGSSSDIWSEKSAFTEIFTPAQVVLQHISKSFKNKVLPVKSALDKINAHLSQAHLTRRPLFLHDHKPLAIKSAIPKFEENFNPDKHYDPDRERAETNRLKKEYKREKKGAMRELRKDASFVAREKLREKKERDSEYEKKYRKLIAEIQSEEGRAANNYEKEKRLRQGKR
jgi:nucleolar protein 14